MVATALFTGAHGLPLGLGQRDWNQGPESPRQFGTLLDGVLTICLMCA
jgi:hypothetical protein